MMIKDRHEPTLLLVEDDPAAALLTKRYLERGGIDNPVIHFDCARDFMDFLFANVAESSAPPFVVILDLNLPDMAGADLLGVIRSAKIQTFQEIPIIIHTTSQAQSDRQRCQALGATAYCVKSFDNDDELTSLVQQNLKQDTIAACLD